MKKETKEVKGLLVVYLNVGQLPPVKAEAMAAKYREKFLSEVPESLKGREFIIIPTRERVTEVVYLPFS